jgi:hypothetical protein
MVLKIIAHDMVLVELQPLNSRTLYVCYVPVSRKIFVDRDFCYFRILIRKDVRVFSTCLSINSMYLLSEVSDVFEASISALRIGVVG